MDQIGTTQTITNSSGAVCYDAEFTPYGQELVHTNTCPQNYKFTGYERDPETGLDYGMARYYNSRLGRFMSADPLSGGIDDPQSLNRYAYVTNSPLNWVDPSGLYRQEQLCTSAAMNTVCAGDFDWLMSGGMVSSGPGSIVLGNDIFDAIRGAPGTYLTIDMYGNIGFGFSIDLFNQTWNWIDSARQNLPTTQFATQSGGAQVISRGDLGMLPVSGFTTVITDLGTGPDVTGFIPELGEAQANVERFYRPGFDEYMLATEIASMEGEGAPSPDDIWRQITAFDPLAAQYWPYYQQAVNQWIDVSLQYIPGLLGR